ncbi:MAG: S-layer family protein [Symploca sp. SIO3C6]|uniref:S-layer family protein n=1 Tax=Symploca sp. SIO1C4 TaxID=2607765 RepID=A0A6B3NI38_9CYAN|nr:S-layer family protein [Symploca sp. SIO3C6]NER31370.1 S-layer family protein [Symploca sp. SIO1C4]
MPSQLVDVSRLVAQSCPSQQGSTFVVTGRGGMPPTPREVLSSDSGWRDWRNLAQVSRQQTFRQELEAGGNSDTSFDLQVETRQKHQIVEAQGWVKSSNGWEIPMNDNYYKFCIIFLIESVM